jgi:hypothetical protein
MRILLPLLLILFLSCNKYQFFTVSAENIKKNQSKDLVFENDTLRVAYRFSGKNGPVDITIFNKTREPVEVNWRKSALIFQEKAYAYYSPDMYLRSHKMRDSIGRGGFGRPALNADIYVNEQSQYIPPGSSVAKIPLHLPVGFYYSAILKKQPARKFKYKNAVHGISHKKLEFEGANSPIRFRSFLTLNFGDNPGREFILDQEFYISELWELGHGPYAFPMEIRKQGDLFYVIE